MQPTELKNRLLYQRYYSKTIHSASFRFSLNVPIQHSEISTIEFNIVIHSSQWFGNKWNLIMKLYACTVQSLDSHWHWKQFSIVSVLSEHANTSHCFFLVGGGLSGDVGRTYWMWWNGERWALVCLELQCDKVKRGVENTRPNMTLSLH